MKTLVTATAGILLAACAPTPSSIEPVAPPPEFAAVSCRQVGPKLKVEEEALAVVVAEQEKAAANDAASVAIIGVPLSALNNGNKEQEIAIRKGRVIALKQRMEACS